MRSGLPTYSAGRVLSLYSPAARRMLTEHVGLCFGLALVSLMMKSSALIQLFSLSLWHMH